MGGFIVDRELEEFIGSVVLEAVRGTTTLTPKHPSLPALLGSGSFMS
jgi:hypothetical protein